MAGVSYFATGTTGTPLTWAQGTINYYTDQGNLSPILQGANADSFVAAAFNQWTAIPTAAISAIHAGQLAEDVSGANFFLNSNGTVNMPADILPTAINTPVAVIYDFDGSVTDAVLGQGAGAASNCFTNAVFGGVDNFGVKAQFLHALIVLNGNCMQSSSQLPDIQYRLVRLIGRVLGLDWSQVNLNVLTRQPPPGTADYAGFPLMHAVDIPSCVPISLCYPNASQPKTDDVAALSRLYPVTAQTLSNFPGKQLFSQNTIRIHGSVYFADSTGQAAQPMQGVNVVAHWIDPTTAQPSRAVAAASVSGFLFCGNAGNIVTGSNDSSGRPWSTFGSNVATTEGFFDLAGLPVPNGSTTAQYQLTVEALDPFWSQTVGPYGPAQVQLSGSSPPILVTAAIGGDVQQDIVMLGSATQQPAYFQPTSYSSPAAVPAEGDWIASLGPYGDADYFWFNGRANRTMSVVATALDEGGVPTQDEALPVIGMWALSDPGLSPAPAKTPMAFNVTGSGESRLDAVLQSSSAFRIGIADYRGDGRPDYRYRARVFYGDDVTPTRISVAGGDTLTIRGYGLSSGTNVALGQSGAPVLGASAGRLLVTTPPMPDGVQNISLMDFRDGAASTMTGVLTYGASASDTLRLISGANPPTPVGGQAALPVTVQVVAASGAMPVAGASVLLVSSPAASLAICGGSSTCTVLSDLSGEVSTAATILSPGINSITAKLAPASYPNPQTVQATIFGSSSVLDISLTNPFLWIAQGATLDVPLIARMLSSGNPLRARMVNYILTKGSGTFSAGSALTDSNGYASSTLHVAAISGDVQVSACVAPANAPCQTFYGTAVPVSALQLQALAGTSQVM